MGNCLRSGSTHTMSSPAERPQCEDNDEGEDRSENQEDDNNDDVALTDAVKRRDWSKVGEVLRSEAGHTQILQSGAGHTQRMWAITQACELIGEEAVIQHIIPHLRTEGELEAVFRSITWNLDISRLLGKLLQRGLDLSLFVWVVGALNRVYVYCTDEFLEEYLVPVCSADHLLSLFTLSVRERQWRTVSSFLRHGMGDEQRRWAVEEALHHATPENDEDTSGVIAHCSDDQLGVVFEEAVRRHLWRTVRKLLDRPVDDDLVRQAIEESCRRDFGEPLADYTLPACRDDQHRDFELTHAVRQGQWEAVGHLLKCAVDDALLRWAVTEGSGRADDGHLVEYILPHCADDQLDSQLTQAVTREQWRAVGFLLQRGVDDKLRRWAVTEGSGRADEYDLVEYILPHCDDDQLDSLLTQAVRRKQWRAVGFLLQHGVDDTLHKWAVPEGSGQTTEDDLVGHFLPPCADDHLDYPLTQAVSREKRRADEYSLQFGDILQSGAGHTQILQSGAGHTQILQSGAGHTQRMWAVTQACELAGEETVTQHIVPHLHTEGELEAVFSSITWHLDLSHLMGKLLQRGLDLSLFVWVVGALNRVCVYCTHEFLEKSLVPVCSADQLLFLFTLLVRERQWRTVSIFLRHGMGHKQRRWAVEEALQHATPENDEDPSGVIAYCSDDQLGVVFEEAVRGHLWRTVRKLLARPVDGDLVRQAIEESCRSVCGEPLTDYTLPACRDDQRLDFELTHAVRQGWWYQVCQLLERVVDDTLCRWAVSAGSGRAGDVHLVRYILPHCDDNQLDYMLTQAVRRKQWRAVGFLLQRGVHDIQHKWAVTEASGQTTDDDHVRHFLPPCAEDHLDYPLTQAVSREKRRAEEYLLKSGDILQSGAGHTQILQSGAGHTQRMWAIAQACQFAGKKAVIRHIVPHLHTEGELELVFSSITWNLDISRLLGKLLQRGLDMSLFLWVVGALNRVNVYCTDEFLQKYIESVCSADQLLCLLTLSVRERQWRTVASFLRLEMEDEQRRWAVEEALHHVTPENDVDTSGVIAYCSDDQLGVVFKKAVRRHIWWTVMKLLDRPVGGDLVRQAIEESCRSICDQPLIDYTLPACRDDQRRDFELTHAVRRGQWKDVSQLLERGVHDTLRRWAVTEGSGRADDDDLVECILPHCTDNQLDSLLTQAVKWKQWRAVGFLLQRGVVDTLHRWAMLEAGKHADEYNIVQLILPLCSNVPSDVINSPQHTGEARSGAEAGEGADGSWRESHKRNGLTVDQLHLMLDKAVRRGLWEVSSQCPQTERHAGRDCPHTAVHLHGHGLEQVLLRVVKHRSNELLFCVLAVSSERNLTRVITAIRDHIDWRQKLSDIVCRSVAAMTPFPVDETGFSKLIDFSEDCHLHTLAIVYLDVLHFVVCPELDSARKHSTKNLQTVVSGWQQQLAELYVNTKYSIDTEQALVYLFFCLCRSLDLTEESSDLLCVVLSTIPLLPSMQSVAVRLMLRDKRWDVINNAVLWRVWEDVRRSVLRAAVEQREWTTVRHMADHSLYDDERNWALMQAYYEDRWDVVLALADFGHNADQRKRIYRQVAKHGDGETILELFKRGADVSTVREQLETASPSRERPLRQETVARYQNRLSWLAWLERKIEDTADNLQGAIQRNKWRAVLHRVRCEPSTLSLALDAAIEKEAWHVVVQLARLGMDAAQRDSLFPEVIRRRQWAVGRALLEGGYTDGGQHGVSVELRRAALPQLLNVGQWILVARVMEHGVDDKERRQVMWEALARREGGVVAHIISIMEGRVCVEERERVFQQAIRQGVWQALKRLVEEKDSAGITHRDLTLPAAAKHHQWDILTHCLQHGADVDKQDAAGDTMLHRAAREGDWEGVQGLLLHGVANQHLLDRRGYSVLHMAVKDGWGADWSAVKILVEFQCDVNQPDPRGVTPLQRMIKDNQGEIIKSAMFWGRNVGQTITEEGETALHALCQAGVLDNIHIAVARGGDPLAVTNYRGDTVLSLAVKNKKCPRELLAECIQLGVSTHQPRITDHWMERVDNGVVWYNYDTDLSPMCRAIRHCNKAITEMLYESGSCSNRELYYIAHRWFVHSHIDDPSNVTDNEEMDDDSEYVYVGYDKDEAPWNIPPDEVYDVLFCYAKYGLIPPNQAAYVSAIVNTPRRLESMCRLVISHHIGVCKPRRRRERVMALRLPTWFRHLQDYILFTDLTGPESGRVRPRRSAKTNNSASRYTFHLVTIQDKMAVYFSLSVHNYCGRWQLSHSQQL